MSISFESPIVFVGFGAVARAAWRVGRASLGWSASQGVAIDPSPAARDAATIQGLNTEGATINPMNFR